jgi:hypothetical protein
MSHIATGIATPAGVWLRAKRVRPAALLLLVAFLLTLQMLVAAIARADTATFEPVADAYVSDDQPDANFGTASELRIKSSNPVQHTYLRFDVALPDGAEIQGATLRLYTSVAMSTRGFDIYGVASDSWDEGTITDANAPAFGAPLAWSGAWTTEGYRELSLPASSLATGLNSFGVGNESSYYKPFGSRESNNPPQLVVDYTTATPAPSPTPDGTPTPTPDPSGGDDPTVAAAGDIACDPASSNYNAGSGTASSCHQKYTSDLLVGRDLAGVLPLGDTQYEQGTLAAFKTSFDPTWGREKNIMHPAVGNHEYQTPGAAGYFDYFNGVGAASGPAGARNKGYYSFDIGAWHLIALNSNCSEVGGCGSGSPQETWLKDDLAHHANKCTLAYWHHPRFSSGAHGTNAAMQTVWNDLQDAGADVVLTGHDHDYERFAPQTATGVADAVNGIREFVVGTGGKSHYSFAATPAPNSEMRSSDTYGVLMLTLHATGYDWQFVPEAGKAFTDRGSDACH